MWTTGNLFPLSWSQTRDSLHWVGFVILVLYGTLILLMSSWRSVISDGADFNSNNVLWICYFIEMQLAQLRLI